MTDIDTIREALTDIHRQFLSYVEHHSAKGADDKAITNGRFVFMAADALQALARLAARVGEGWCFDMERAPRADGAEVDLWTERGRVPDCHWHEGEWLHWAYQSVDDEPRWERITPIAWRPLPKPPDTDDDQ